MTALEIVKQTETLSISEQKSLISFLILKYINPNEKQNLMQLFHYKNDFEEKSIVQNKKPLDNFMKSKGILKDVDLSDITEEDLYLQKN